MFTGRQRSYFPAPCTACSSLLPIISRIPSSLVGNQVRDAASSEAGACGKAFGEERFQLDEGGERQQL